MGLAEEIRRCAERLEMNPHDSGALSDLRRLRDRIPGSLPPGADRLVFDDLRPVWRSLADQGHTEAALELLDLAQTIAEYAPEPVDMEQLQAERQWVIQRSASGLVPDSPEQEFRYYGKSMLFGSFRPRQSWLSWLGYVAIACSILLMGYGRCIVREAGHYVDSFGITGPNEPRELQPDRFGAVGRYRKTKDGAPATFVIREKGDLRLNVVHAGGPEPTRAVASLYELRQGKAVLVGSTSATFHYYDTKDRRRHHRSVVTDYFSVRRGKRYFVSLLVYGAAPTTTVRISAYEGTSNDGPYYVAAVAALALGILILVAASRRRSFA